jgi:DNA-binding response OmpR family regulator
MEPTETEQEPLGEPSEKLVLIIDDDEYLREVMQHAMQREGFDTELASTAAEAFHKIADRRPDLILLDLMIPGEGGYELVRRLQGTEAGRIPVIMVTGACLDRSTQDLLRSEPNVAEFFEKPLRFSQLGLLMHDILGTRQAPRRAPNRLSLSALSDASTGPP